jgi:hypothetical protein
MKTLISIFLIAVLISCNETPHESSNVNKITNPESLALKADLQTIGLSDDYFKNQKWLSHHSWRDLEAKLNVSKKAKVSFRNVEYLQCKISENILVDMGLFKSEKPKDLQHKVKYADMYIANGGRNEKLIYDLIMFYKTMNIHSPTTISKLTWLLNEILVIQTKEYPKRMAKNLELIKEKPFLSVLLKADNQNMKEKIILFKGNYSGQYSL